MTTSKRRLIVGITGASGVIYGVRLLQLLRDLPGIETHAVFSPSAFLTAQTELDMTSAEMRALPDVEHAFKDIGAAISSGSFRTEGMIVAPCSIKTLSGIANCYADQLITRAADVCLKERRRVVLMLRETPLHAGHLALMQQATMAGAIIMPPVPAFYAQPKSLDDIVVHSVARALDLFGIEAAPIARWKEPL